MYCDIKPLLRHTFKRKMKCHSRKPQPTHDTMGKRKKTEINAYKINNQMSQHMTFWHLSHRRQAKAEASLRIRAVSPEPSLFAHMIYGSRQRVGTNIRHLAPLDGCPCAFEEWVYGGRKVPTSDELAQMLDKHIDQLSRPHAMLKRAETNTRMRNNARFHTKGLVVKTQMSRLMTKPTKWLCAHRRLRSAWASTQSNQSLRCEGSD